jgi:UDP-galactopyranose mutase
MKKYDYLIVGSGFFGAVLAERLANGLGRSVLVVEQRDHIGGNCHSAVDEETGIEFHQYGTHIFHTPHREVWEYINRFTEFNGYRHQVLNTYQDRVYQMPINLETINSFYDLNLKPAEARKFIEEEVRKSGIKEPRNLEEKAISLIGRPLYEAFIRGYTIKQWRKDTRDLSEDIITRLPVRFSYNESYYSDRWQGIPLEGYTRIFERLLASPKIRVELNADYFDLKDSVQVKEKVIYSGSLDRYFNYEYGRLEWRSCEFRKEVAAVEDFQGTSVMNYADLEIPYTRIHEPRHLHEERNYPKDRTLIIKEFPRTDFGEAPFYPIPDRRNLSLYEKYQKLTKREGQVIFGGRLADYKYYDMHDVIYNALSVSHRLG